MEFTRTVTVYIDIDAIVNEFMEERYENTKEDLILCIRRHISSFEDREYYVVDGLMIDEVYNALLQRQKIRRKINL